MQPDLRRAWRFGESGDMHPDIRRPWKLGEFRDITSAQACFLTEPCMAQIELLIVIKKKKSQFAKMSSQIGPQRVPQGSCRSRPGRPRPRPGTPAWPAPGPAGPARAGPGQPGPGRGPGAPSGDLFGTTFWRTSPQSRATFWVPFWSPKGPLGHPKRGPKGRLLGCLGELSREGDFRHPSQVK